MASSPYFGVTMPVDGFAHAFAPGEFSRSYCGKSLGRMRSQAEADLPTCRDCSAIAVAEDRHRAYASRGSS